MRLGFQHPGRAPAILVDAFAGKYGALAQFTGVAAHQVAVVAELVRLALRVGAFGGIVDIPETFGGGIIFRQSTGKSRILFTYVVYIYIITNDD